ncbi:MAG: NifB/NifX family molybdenum-iron cluster-binding protein [Campylobacterota bacterium]|nr:NifB/NifX family molybdenum-iron cluster-binding protein [Campylobacterota bacterium]
MKVAFASKDNIHINQHFGWCEMFYIYEIFEDDYSLINEVDSSLKFDNEIEKLEYKISCLEDSDIVYVSQIGPKAANMVKSEGIYPMKSSNEAEKIKDVIISFQKMIKGNPPLWLKRILMKGGA